MTNLHTISVRNLEFEGRHGVYAEERASFRRFQVDIDLRGDFSDAIGSDKLADTVDYHAVSAIVDEIGRTQTFHLLEAMAGAMASAIAEKCPHAAIELEVRKLNPPCPGNPSYTAFRLTRPARLKR